MKREDFNNFIGNMLLFLGILLVLPLLLLCIALLWVMRGVGWITGSVTGCLCPGLRPWGWLDRCLDVIEEIIE